MDQEQASGFGGLTAVSTLKPAGPKFASTAFCQSPELTIFSSAVLTFLQRSTSPYFSPTP